MESWAMSFSDLKSLESLPWDRDDRSGQPHPHHACCQITTCQRMPA
jgi:hypothetical protein